MAKMDPCNVLSIPYSLTSFELFSSQTTTDSSPANNSLRLVLHRKIAPPSLSPTRPYTPREQLVLLRRCNSHLNHNLLRTHHEGYARQACRYPQSQMLIGSQL